MIHTDSTATGSSSKGGAYRFNHRERSILLLSSCFLLFINSAASASNSSSNNVMQRSQGSYYRRTQRRCSWLQRRRQRRRQRKNGRCSQKTQSSRLFRCSYLQQQPVSRPRGHNRYSAADLSSWPCRCAPPVSSKLIASRIIRRAGGHCCSKINFLMSLGVRRRCTCFFRSCLREFCLSTYFCMQFLRHYNLRGNIEQFHVVTTKYSILKIIIK